MMYRQTDQENLWIYPSISSAWIDSIVHQYHVHPVIAQVLISRGFTSLAQIHKYLYAKLPDLYDPSLLQDMDKATRRVCQALDQGEDILIYGDNDVDGISGTALLMDFLRQCGAKAHFFIPDSDTARPDLFKEALQMGLDNNCKLVITVDCGITAAAELNKFVEQGIEVIVTDHHEPTDKIPNCVATLNPKLVNNSYPNRELTGVGVAFKLAHAITNRLVIGGKISRRQFDLKRHLDLVALGTISDMGALLDENRILVRYGIQQLRKGQRVGLSKLLQVCDVNPEEITSNEIASKLAPRLNSLGRIADPKKGVELLLIRKNADEAQALAKEFDLLNTQRQKIERQVQEDVDKILEKKPQILDDKAIVLYSQHWHPGVIAIVATRLTKQYNRPTVVISINNKTAKGSIRSIPEFPLLPHLKKHSSLLLNFGGHDYAAGLTINAENIKSFKEHFLAAANKTLQDNDVICKLPIDAKVDFNELTFDFMDSLNLLEPYGNENPQPILYADAKQAWPPKVIGSHHLKLYLIQGDRMLEGMAFGMAHKIGLLKKKNLNLRVAFTPQVNVFQNKSSIQLLIKDFKIF
ncbi:MAG: single-stranded-DNA-specific exonuclease RecJ [Chlamydiota bacterium]